MILTF
jgi:importin subunit beta-1